MKKKLSLKRTTLAALTPEQLTAGRGGMTIYISIAVCPSGGCVSMFYPSMCGCPTPTRQVNCD